MVVLDLDEHHERSGGHGRTPIRVLIAPRTRRQRHVVRLLVVHAEPHKLVVLQEFRHLPRAVQIGTAPDPLADTATRLADENHQSAAVLDCHGEGLLRLVLRLAVVIPLEIGFVHGHCGSLSLTTARIRVASSRAARVTARAARVTARAARVTARAAGAA